MGDIRNKGVSEHTAHTTAGAETYDQSEIVRLVVRATHRDFEAFGELYSIYLDRIYKYVLGHLGERMTAQDITEEVFLKAWKAIDSCKGREQTFSAWLYRIARNHLIDYLRRRRRLQTTEIRMESLAGIDDVGQEMELKLEQQRLLEAISVLPDNQRQVIILKFVEGMDNREVGQIMGKSEGNIRVIQMRALRALRHRLSGEK